MLGTTSFGLVLTRHEKRNDGCFRTRGARDGALGSPKGSKFVCIIRSGRI